MGAAWAKLRHTAKNLDFWIMNHWFSDSNQFKMLRIEWIVIYIAIQCFQKIYTLNYNKHKLMETLNSVVHSLCPRISASRAPLFTSSHRIALMHHSSLWHIFWTASVCKSVSSPHTKQFYFSVVCQWLQFILLTLPEQSKAVHLLHGRSKNNVSV